MVIAAGVATIIAYLIVKAMKKHENNPNINVSEVQIQNQTVNSNVYGALPQIYKDFVPK